MIRSVIFSLSVIFTLISVSCSEFPTQVVAPQWDVDLNVPVINRSYSMSDILKPQHYISIQPEASGDSIYLFQSDEYTQSVSIGNFLQVTEPVSVKNVPVLVGKTTPDTVYIPLPEGAELDSAVFENGFFAIHVTNPLIADVSISLTMPGITKPDGSVFNITQNIGALGSDSAAFNFNGCRYVIPPNQPSYYRNSFQVIVKSSSSLLLSYVTMDLYLSDFIFKSVSGRLPSKTLDSKPMSYDLNIGTAADYQGKAFLKEATLNLSAEYLSPASRHFGLLIKNLNITGIRKDGSTLALTDSTGSPNLTLTLANGYLQKTFNEKNSNINSFISFLPDAVTLNGQYVMNPDNNEGTATNIDSVKINANWSTKSYLSVLKSTVTDTSSLSGMTSSDRDKIRNAMSVDLVLNIQNGIPLTTWLKATLTDANFNPLFTVITDGGEDYLYFPGAAIDQNGEVTNPATTVTTVKLDSAQIEKFSRAYYVIYDVSVQTKQASQHPPPVVAIRPEDKINIQAYGAVKFRVNK